MSRSRVIAYSLVAVLGVLALRVRNDQPAAEPELVQPVPHNPLAAPSASASAAAVVAPAPGLAVRTPMRAPLFASSAPAVPAPVQAGPPPPAVVEPKVIGWMMREGKPFVFVEYNGEPGTLTPGEQLEGSWRFDDVGGGFARFTHLPDQVEKRYPVTDPDALD